MLQNMTQLERLNLSVQIERLNFLSVQSKFTDPDLILLSTCLSNLQHLKASLASIPYFLLSVSCNQPCRDLFILDAIKFLI